MVDIGAGHDVRKAQNVQEIGGTASKLLCDVRPADEAALADYQAFCNEAVHAHAQHPVWVRSWVTATGADAFIVTLRQNNRPLLMLALAVTRKGPFRVAGFMGESHANGNFAAMSEDLKTLSASDMQALKNAIRHARPDIDLVLLERQAPEVRAIRNPFGAFPSLRSANVSLATDLSGGMDAVLERMSGKRKRKKYRLQLRRFEAVGSYRWFEASTQDEVERLISEFYVLKAARFRKRGIPDTFGTDETQAFFRRLFHDALNHNPAPFVLHGIEVAGEIRGINGFSVTDHSLVCEFCAIRDDDPSLSPGFYLDYVGIEQACERGKALYDFSVGDDDYKRSWCDIETWPFDTPIPMNARGRLLSALLAGRAKAVRAVKSNRALWTLVKNLRTRLAGTQG